MAAWWRRTPGLWRPRWLCRSMQGAVVLYNTYRVRYVRGRITFDLAVESTRTLFEAAKRAGVGRVVHFSVANASTGSGLPYFRGKAQVEDMLKDLRVPPCDHQTDAGVRCRRPAAQQHGPGAAALPGLPRLWERRLPGPIRLRRRPYGAGGGGRFSERELRG